MACLNFISDLKQAYWLTLRLLKDILSGKYLNGARPKGSRTQLFGRGQRYETESAENSIQRYVDYAKEINMDPSVMANAFVNSRDFVTSNIIGATTMEQLKLAIDSFEVELSEENLTYLDQVHAACPNPCP